MHIVWKHCRFISTNKISIYFKIILYTFVGLVGFFFFFFFHYYFHYLFYFLFVYASYVYFCVRMRVWIFCVDG